MIKIELPKNVESIISQIEEAGFEAYAVGGCIRDSLLQREPNDWDITTSAKPQDIKNIFRRTIDTGIQHGTVTVMIGDEGYEITTYRIDGEYEDGRHPKEVSFTASLEEDLKRRDFTINALAYNESRGLVDLFDGIGDMERKVIRCVGEAKQRFTEDALRIMRAVRFAGQLGYEIEEKTYKAMKELAPNLKKISAERIQVELVKLLVSPHPELLKCAYEAGITKEFMPEFDKCMETTQNHPHHCYGVGDHIIHTVMSIEPTKELRLAALFHDIGKPVVKTVDEEGIDHFYGHPQLSAKMAQDILKRLKFDNDTIKIVSKLVEFHDYKFVESLKGMRRGITKIGEEAFPQIFEIKRADMLAQSMYQRTEKEEALKNAKELYQEVLDRNDCLSLKDLAVTGYDLMEAGVPKGKELGESLNYLLSIVLDAPEKNEKKILIEEIKTHRK